MTAIQLDANLVLDLFNRSHELMARQSELVERAMSATGKQNREAALLEVCQAYLSATGQFGAEG